MPKVLKTTSLCSMFAASLEPLAHRLNVASLSLLYRYYFDRCSSELAQLVPLPFSRVRSTWYSDRLHDFSVHIPRCYKGVHLVNSFFPHIARLWNSLPIEYFLLTYNLNGFKFRINKYLLTLCPFLRDFLHALRGISRTYWILRSSYKKSNIKLFKSQKHVKFGNLKSWLALAFTFPQLVLRIKEFCLNYFCINR